MSPSNYKIILILVQISLLISETAVSYYVFYYYFCSFIFLFQFKYNTDLNIVDCTLINYHFVACGLLCSQIKLTVYIAICVLLI